MLSLFRCAVTRAPHIASKGISVQISRNLANSLIVQNKRRLNTKSYFLQEQKKDDKKAQSILTDDSLFKAGIDVEEGKKEGQQKQHETEEGNEEQQSENSSNKKRKRRMTSADKKKERYANYFYIFTFSSLAGLGLYMCRDWEENEDDEMKKDIDNGYTPDSMYKRFRARFNSVFTYFQEPPFPDSLPPPPPAPYQRPLTLVITLEDFLVHSEWDQKHGWRTAKRPGADYFLGYLSQYYEIVSFSSNYMMYAEKIAEKMDPIHAFISYNLFKEHCVYKDGVHIKDLSKSNRDLKKVMIIDTDENSYKLQPENAIPMDPWDGKADDKLLRLIPFLEYMATQQVEDVRPILKSYHNKRELPAEFEQRVQKLKNKFEQDQKKKNDSNWLLKLLGLAPVINGIGGGNKFPLDMIREEGEKNYVRFMKLIEEEKEKMRIQQEQMSGQTFTLKDYVEGNIPTPEEQMKMQLEKQKEIDALFEQKKKEQQANK